MVGLAYGAALSGESATCVELVRRESRSPPSKRRSAQLRISEIALGAVYMNYLAVFAVRHEQELTVLIFARGRLKS